MGGHGTGRGSGIGLGSGPLLRPWAGPPALGTALTCPCAHAADELELIRPSVYRNVARQLNLSLQSETVVTDAFLAVATQIFSAGEASCPGRGPTVLGAWGLGVVGTAAAAQVGLSGNLAGSEGDGPRGCWLGPLVGFWGYPGRKSWLTWGLGFSQRGARSLAARVGAARLLEPEKLWGRCTRVFWAEVPCQSATAVGGALWSGGAWPKGSLERGASSGSAGSPTAPVGFPGLPSGPRWRATSVPVTSFPCPHLRAAPAPVRTPASRLTGDPRAHPQATSIPTSPPGKPVGSVWPTCDPMPCSVPRSRVLALARRCLASRSRAPPRGEQSPTQGSTFSVADPACPPAPGRWRSQPRGGVHAGPQLSARGCIPAGGRV